MEQLLAIVAHDLRNPLSCIEGYSSLLLNRELPAEERAKLVQRILSCSRFMEQLVADLLDASAIERGDLCLRRSPVALGDVVGQALESMEHTAAARGIRLAFADASGGAVAQADAVRLRQVVQNLVSNAIKHVRQGSGRVDVRLTVAGDELQLEVADDGVGIEEEELGKVFGKFYCGDQERARGSLGLGLFIAQRLVELHHGTLSVRSAGLGRGATFSVRLPVFDPAKRFAAYKALREAATPPARFAA